MPLPLACVYSERPASALKLEASSPARLSEFVTLHSLPSRRLKHARSYNALDVLALMTLDLQMHDVGLTLSRAANLQHPNSAAAELPLVAS